MKTNFKMIEELLKEYEPKKRGIVSMDEIYFINEKLCLDKMDELQLRNLRDFVVLFFDNRDIESYDDVTWWDKMSAITCVIDDRLIRLGAEV